MNLQRGRQKAAVGFEPTMAYASGFAIRPLDPLGHAAVITFYCCNPFVLSQIPCFTTCYVRPAIRRWLGNESTSVAEEPYR